MGNLKLLEPISTGGLPHAGDEFLNLTRDYGIYGNNVCKQLSNVTLTVNL